MKRFILDTTEFKEQRRLESAHFRVLVRAQKLLGDRVCIPEVTIREYVRHTRQRIEEQVGKRDAAAHELRRITMRDFPLEMVDVEHETNQWAAWLRDHLAALKIDVLPIPAPAHEELLQRDLERRKPFNQGKGYRDALIWASVVEDARMHRDAELVMVTGNSSDFAQGDQLHADLLRDLDGVIDRARVSYASNMQVAVERHVSRRLPPPDEASKVLLQQSLSYGGRLHKWIVDNVPRSIERIRLGVTGPLEEARVLRCKYVSAVTVTEVRRIDDELFAEVDAQLVADLTPAVTVPVPTLDASGSSEVLAIAGRYLLAHLMLSSTTIVVRFGLTVNAAGDPSAMDVWDARIASDVVELLQAAVPRSPA